MPIPRLRPPTPRRRPSRAAGCLAWLLALAWFAAQTHLPLHVLAHDAERLADAGARAGVVAPPGAGLARARPTATADHADEPTCPTCIALAHAAAAAWPALPNLPAAPHLSFHWAPPPAVAWHLARAPEPRAQGPPSAG